jgi:hypothetical protein
MVTAKTNCAKPSPQQTIPSQRSRRKIQPPHNTQPREDNNQSAPSILLCHTTARIINTGGSRANAAVRIRKPARGRAKSVESGGGVGCTRVREHSRARIDKEANVKKNEAAR